MVWLSNFLQPKFVFNRLTPETTATLKIAIKTGVAALLTHVLATALRLPSPYWADITTLIVMQANLGSSFNASFQRLAGTAVGAATGALVSSLSGMNPLGLAVGTTVTILICAFLRIYESFRIATVTLVIVVMVGGEHSNPWSFGAERFLDVGFGILIALAVTIGLWPPRSRQELRLTLTEILRQDANLYQFLLANRFSNQYKPTPTPDPRSKIRAALNKARVLMTDIGREPPSLLDPPLTKLLSAIERLQADLFALDREMTGEDTLHHLLGNELMEVSRTTTQAFEALAEALAQKRAPKSLDELQQSLQTLEEHYSELRRLGSLRSLSVEEVLHFVGFLFIVREVATGIKELSAAIAGVAV